MKRSEDTRLVLISGKSPNSEAISPAPPSTVLTPTEEPEFVRDLVFGQTQGRPLSDREFCLDRAISQFSDIVSNTHSDFEIMLSRLLKVGRYQLGLDSAMLTRFDGGECEIVAIDSGLSRENYSAQQNVGAHYPLAGAFCIHTTYQSEPFTYNATEPNQNRPDILRRKCYIGAALKIKGQTYGCLSFSSTHSRKNSFCESEKLFVKTMARYIGNVIETTEVNKALKYRIDFEKLITEISANFINLSPSEIDDGICEALHRIGQFSGVDLTYVFMLKDGNRKMDMSHWWFADNSTPRFRLKDIPVEKYTWTMSPAFKGEVTYVPNINTLSPDASAERRFMIRHGIKSAILVPMIHSGAPIGVVGFASQRLERAFDGDVIKLLQMVGHILGNAVEFKRAQQALSSLEAQFRHAQKLESLGVLAGGIAHDFNNLLMGIIGNTTLAKSELPLESPARPSIDKIDKIAQHATDLTSQLLAYSGKGKFCVEVLNFAHIVDNMVDLLKSAISKKHRLEYNFPRCLPAVEGDATQISQVIMNLITNASEAIGDKKGTITLNTGLIAVDKEYLIDVYLSADTPEGVYVYLRIADTGSGMDEETLSKIFDPFFTTKLTGRGLGLAAVLGIVRSHRGIIKVQSSPGQGTSFTVLFPCSEKQPKIQTIAPVVKSKTKLTGRILVVDDEESVRTVVSQLLEKVGFQVLSAKDGREAIEIYRSHAGKIDAALVDLTMPDMDGREVCREFHRISSDTQLILTSGYSKNEIVNQFEGQEFSSFIQKPYKPEHLVQTIFELLNRNNRE